MRHSLFRWIRWYGDTMHILISSILVKPPSMILVEGHEGPWKGEVSNLIVDLTSLASPPCPSLTSWTEWRLLFDAVLEGVLTAEAHAETPYGIEA